MFALNSIKKLYYLFINEIMILTYKQKLKNNVFFLVSSGLYRNPRNYLKNLCLVLMISTKKYSGLRCLIKSYLNNFDLNDSHINEGLEFNTCQLRTNS